MKDALPDDLGTHARHVKCRFCTHQWSVVADWGNGRPVYARCTYCGEPGAWFYDVAKRGQIAMYEKALKMQANAKKKGKRR